jgi:hypothetical protein
VEVKCLIGISEYVQFVELSVRAVTTTKNNNYNNLPFCSLACKLSLQHNPLEQKIAERVHFCFKSRISITQ